MSIEADEEILQDFLIEADEILELLSEQLVELENNPEDNDLLNTIFRGYHTVKGGAGFLGLTALVDICHIAENVFDLLRNGDQKVTPELMDISLKALDCVNDMFEAVKNGDAPEAADAEIIKELERYSVPFDEMEEGPAVEEEEAQSSDISEDEFDALLDDLHGSGGAPGKADTVAATSAKNSSANDDISEDEFDALLDELHGEGSAPGKKSDNSVKTKKSKSKSKKSKKAASEEITEDEFDALLDELHGDGQISGTPETTQKTPAKAKKKKPDDKITDDEFESLLDDLHGKNGAPSGSSETPSETPVSKTAPAPKDTDKPSKKTTPTKPKSEKTSAKSKAQKKPPVTTESTVRVDTRRLDDIMNMVGELVLVRNRLMSIGHSYTDESLAKAVSNLDIVTGDLQTAVMKTRMQPIKKVFGRFPRVVRDLARNLKKEITLELIGEETDLDKNLVEALADPLVHLVRNSVDHGIEMPDDREKSGKERMGKIILSASQEGDHILLKIVDDGAGMDKEILRGLAVKKGMMEQDAADRLTESDCYNLILQPGFSTKEEVSDISGRGVGMDVVKTRITQLNGSIIIDSEMGKGTTINIKVPLTLAILPTLMVVLGDATFALPLASVNEIFHLDLTRTNRVDGQLTIIVREKAIPLFYLEDWLVKPENRKGDKQEGHVVIFSNGTQRVGFVVDSLVGQEEVVIKPLGAVLQGTPGMAGATITSDGSIALILDVPSLLTRYA